MASEQLDSKTSSCGSTNYYLFSYQPSLVEPHIVLSHILNNAPWLDQPRDPPVAKAVVEGHSSPQRLTPIGNILGPSPSVIFGNKIQNFFFDNFRQLWRHTLQLDSDVICGSEGIS